MDIFERDNGTTTAETVHQREEFRQIVTDVGELPETQRTALLLREIDALSYDQIAETMDTTVPSVKSLLVRARVSLAEASEARLLTCEEVREELGEVAEGLTRTSAPVRRHLTPLRALPHLPRRAQDHYQGAGRRVPDRPADLPQEARHRQARLRRRRGSRRRGRRARRSRAAPAWPPAALPRAAPRAGGVVSAGISTIASKAAAGMAAAVIVTGRRRRGEDRASTATPLPPPRASHRRRPPPPQRTAARPPPRHAAKRKDALPAKEALAEEGGGEAGRGARRTPGRTRRGRGSARGRARPGRRFDGHPSAQDDPRDRRPPAPPRRRRPRSRRS